MHNSISVKGIILKNRLLSEGSPNFESADLHLFVCLFAVCNLELSFLTILVIGLECVTFFIVGLLNGGTLTKPRYKSGNS